MVSQKKQTKMAKTSLEQFNSIIDTYYPDLKKFIVHQKGKHITLEDWDGNFMFGAKNNLSVFFEHPNKFNIRRASVKFNEKESYFTILIELN